MHGGCDSREWKAIGSDVVYDVVVVVFEWSTLSRNAVWRMILQKCYLYACSTWFRK